MPDNRAFSNVAYDEIQKDVESNRWLVYTVSPDQLPSQYRSLKLYPTSSSDDVEQEPERVSQKPSCSSRVVYAILASIFVISVAVAATVSCLEIQKVLQEEERDVQSVTVNSSRIANLDNSRLTPTTNRSDVTANLHVPRSRGMRTRCVTTCTTYSRPGFRSRCVAGYCVCQGQGYQHDTCLPKFQQCAIQKKTNGSTKAYLSNDPVPVYSCTVESQPGPSLHVISVYGNHFHEQTVLSVTGSKDKATTLVLASQYPVHWKLKYSGIDIRRIIMISGIKSSLGRYTVNINSDITNNHLQPEVTYIHMPIGYGDDRHSSNTTEMLRRLTGKFGPVRSFTGAVFADHFSLKL